MRVSLGAVTAVLLLTLSASPARAADGVSDLLVWVPDRANLVLFVDVDAIRNSEAAKKGKWGAGGQPTSGLDSLPPGVSRLLVASQFDPGSGPGWEVIVAGLRKPVTDAEFVKGVGGPKDTVGGKTVVLTPRHGYAVNLAPGVAGTYQPPNRQEASRWLRGVNGKVSPNLSAFLKKAGAAVTGEAPVVLAIDTTDMLDPALIKAGLSGFKALKGKAALLGGVADLFGQMHGFTLTIRVTDKLAGEIRLDFGRPADSLRDFAKPLLLEVTERMGVHSDEMDGWVAAVQGNTVTFGGELTEDAARGLLAPFLRPSVGTVDQTGQGPPPEQTKAEASLKYYRAVRKKVDEVFKSKDATYAKLAGTFSNAARHIDDLPILNVDDELLDWGNSVATTFRSMSIVAMTAGNMITAAEAQKAMVTVSTPNYFTGSWGGYGAGFYGGYGWGYQYAVPSGTVSTATVTNYGEARNFQGMTREQEIQYRRNTWKNLDTATTEVRRKMVKKYNIEF